ncbi:hypothetical protein, partial [Tritonibacter sp. SIMBA_163]|uniref:hypothetical protein n=1 Tax=Tritonibacter sp. SIMBA_163 TaxID=3080868 RepID=UPI00397F36FD
YQLATWVSVLLGVVAALYWYRSSIAEVDAPAGSGGVGALLGGDLVALSKGKRIDLVKSLQLQSRYNGVAAIAACMASVAQIVAWTATA